MTSCFRKILKFLKLLNNCFRFRKFWNRNQNYFLLKKIETFRKISFNPTLTTPLGRIWRVEGAWFICCAPFGPFRISCRNVFFFVFLNQVVEILFTTVWAESFGIQPTCFGLIIRPCFFYSNVICELIRRVIAMILKHTYESILEVFLP